MTTDIKQKIKRSRLDIAREKAAQAQALLQKLEAQEQVRKTSEKRQLDTRRKVLLGAYLLNKIERDAEAKDAVLADLEKFLTRPAERALFNLAPLTGSESSPREECSGILTTPSV
jgi:hypothetical protein